jgi:pyrrolidone-carboxylate peptidase
MTIAAAIASAAASAVEACGEETANAPATSAADQPEQQVPVILLTGFEPFGPGRPANPSWEGIKQLDGGAWGDYVLACREMKVEWGAPLVQLSAWIDELRPVAVFSFGQGGGFAIETRARNQRGGGADNLGARPATPNVSAEGPREFTATIDAEKLAQALVEQDFPVRVSENAGQYLCEEALYSLELLKSQGRVGAVMFCHVPPLGAEIDGKPVTADLVQEFVERLLEVWDEQRPNAPASVRDVSGDAALRQAAADPREGEIRALVDRYFTTWSAGDLERYGQCFMPQAAVQLVDPDGKLLTMPLRAFLESQREGRRRSGPGMTEAAESVEVRFEGRLARVVVFWKLVEGERTEFGYDHFTLMQANGQWRIANLIFYATPEGERP